MGGGEITLTVIKLVNINSRDADFKLVIISSGEFNNREMLTTCTDFISI